MPILDLGDPEPTISDGALASVCWGNKEHFSSTPPNFTTVCPYLFIFHLLSLSHNLHYTLFFITLCPSLLSCLSPAPSVCHCRWLPLIEPVLLDYSYLMGVITKYLLIGGASLIWYLDWILVIYTGPIHLIKFNTVLCLLGQKSTTVYQVEC